jgi:hypothetical protein
VRVSGAASQATQPCNAHCVPSSRETAAAASSDAAA